MRRRPSVRPEPWWVAAVGAAGAAVGAAGALVGATVGVAGRRAAGDQHGHGEHEYQHGAARRCQRRPLELFGVMGTCLLSLVRYGDTLGVSTEDDSVTSKIANRMPAIQIRPGDHLLGELDVAIAAPAFPGPSGMGRCATSGKKLVPDPRHQLVIGQQVYRGHGQAFGGQDEPRSPWAEAAASRKSWECMATPSGAMAM